MYGKGCQGKCLTFRSNKNCFHFCTSNVPLYNVTYVTLLKVLMMTRQRVTSRTILAGTTSVGMRKLTHDMTTNMAVGK